MDEFSEENYGNIFPTEKENVIRRGMFLQKSCQLKNFNNKVKDKDFNKIIKDKKD